MSGIVGIWNLDGRPVEGALLSRLSATLAHRGSDGEDLWIQGPVGLACRLFRVTPEASTETQPLLGPSGSVLVFDGRLDNREELFAVLGSSPGISADAPDPAFVLAAYEAWGEGFLERLNGDFALGLFDPRRQRLLLAQDAVGVRPLYYCQTPGSVLFASEVKALLAHPQIRPRPHDGVLAEFLLGRRGHNHGASFFEGVSGLLPGHLVIVAPSGVVIRRYWDFDTTRRLRLRSFAEYAEAFGEHFERAVRRRLRSAYPVAVSVSGGVDSSAVFCLAETLRRCGPDRVPPVIGISNPCEDGSPADESAFLAAIEREYGLTLERVPMARTGFLDGCQEAIWYTEAPMLDGQWNNTCAFLSAVRERGVRVLLTGNWGDQVLFEQAYLIDLLHRLDWRQLRTHLEEFPRWFTDLEPREFRQRFLLDLVAFHVPRRLLPFLRELRAKLVPGAGERPWYTEAFRRQGLPSRANGPRRFGSAHARSLYETARARTYLLGMEWNNKVGAMHGLEMAFPFLDRDLISFLIAIPGEIQAWKGVPKAILREALRGVLPDAIARRTWKGDYTHLENEGMELEYPRLAGLLRSDGMAVRLGYVKGDVMRQELERLRGRIRGPTCEVAWSLLNLLLLEVWLQVFWGEPGHREAVPEQLDAQPTTVSGGTG